ncbi:MAG: hypothetical protein U9M89_01045 [Patescibacteria group bacterium]|nr:hypothetical protein [Patescibacteria group bacterium]
MEVIWFVVIVIVFGLALLWLIFKLSKKKKWFTEADREEIRLKFKEIDKLLEAGHNSQAVMHADKLTDHVLQKMNFKGNTMADRMRDAESIVGGYYQDFWWAHKLRNQIVHEINIEIDESTARKAIRVFRQVVNKLKAV